MPENLQTVPLRQDDAALIERLLTAEPSFVMERLNPHDRRPLLSYIGWAGVSDQTSDPAEVFPMLRAALAHDTAGEALPPGARGGVMAMLGYQALDGVGGPHQSAATTPALLIFKPEVLVTIDHDQRRAYVWQSRPTFVATQVVDLLAAGATSALPEPSSTQTMGRRWTPAVGEDEFCAFARVAQAGMAPAGDLNGVVLSVQLTSEGGVDPARAYRTLRAINPSTYMFLLRSAAIDLWGATSLTLVEVANEQLLAETDGATRPYEDESFQWTPTEKEVAEYKVVIDALHEDLHPIIAPGTLTPVAEMEERRFFKLAHLFASFSGTLAGGVDAVEAVRRLSPHGAAVGHLKAGACEVIERLEATPRGPFAGTVGFFGFDGSVSATAVTRSMWQTQDKLYVQAGAKVVPTSDPAGEYQECVLKTLALRRCVEAVGAPERLETSATAD